MSTKDIVSTDALNQVWGDSEFGNQPRRDVIAECLEHLTKGFHPPSTANAICRELGLTKEVPGPGPRVLTDLGFNFLIAFHQDEA